MELGLFIPGHQLEPVGAKEFYRQIVDQAVLADEIGIDMVWLAEHFLLNYVAIPDPLQLCSLILDRTSKIKAGVAVFIAPNHHPLKLAAQMAQIDVTSDGRFMAAMGRGASGYELRQFNLIRPEAESRSYFREHFDIMVRAWRSEKSIKHEGQHFNFNNATLVPRPHTPDAPLWLAALTEGSATGNVFTCCDLDTPVRIIHSPFREPFTFVEKVYRAFEAALAQRNVAREEAKFAVNRVAFCAETQEQVRAMLPAVRRMHRGLVGMLADEESVVDGKLEIKPVANEPTDEEILTNTLMGTPDTLVEHIQRYADLGVDHLSLYMNVGQPHDQIVSSMKLFGEKVLPRLREKGIVA